MTEFSSCLSRPPALNDKAAGVKVTKQGPILWKKSNHSNNNNDNDDKDTIMVLLSSTIIFVSC